MAIIRIKRSTGVVGPSSLAIGEIAVTVEQATQGAWNNAAGRLFVGNASGTPVQVGGEYYTELLNHEPSIITDSSAVIVGSSGTVSNWNVVGVSTFGNVNVTGISTFTTYIDANGGAYIDNIQVGISNNNEIDTTTGNLTLDSAGGTVTIDDQLIVTGLSTFQTPVAITSDFTVSSGHVTITGVGIGTTTDVTDLSALYVVGISTFTSNVDIAGTLSYPTGIVTNLTVTDLDVTSHLDVGGDTFLSGVTTATRLGITEDLTVGAGATVTGNVSIASSLTVGAGNSEFYVLDSGIIKGNTLSLVGLNTNTLVYIGTDYSLRDPIGLSYAESPNILTVDGTVAISSVYASVGVITDLSGTNLLYSSGIITSIISGAAGTQYSLPAGAGTTGQVLKMIDGGSTEFVTLDFRLNYQSDNLAGTVGLGSETWDILGTANQIKTDAPGIGRTLTIALTDDVTVGGALTVSGDMTVGGSLTVQGNLTYLDSTITQIQDKKIELAYADVPSDITADGGGISIRGDSEYEIVWSNSVDAFTVNQSWYPLNSDQLDLGSESQQWRQLFVQGTSELTNTNIAGIVTAQQVEILSGSINDTTIGAATSNTASVTSLSYTSASGGDITATTIDATDLNIQNLSVTGVTTVATLFVSTNPALNAVAYAGTSGIVGFTSAPASGISTSTYILTSIGGVPVFTDTIDCGTY